MIKHSFRKTSGRRTKSVAESIQTKEAEPDKTTVQAKLKIGQPNDAYEQEADRVADQVVRSEAAPQSQNTQNASGIQQKKEDEELQTRSVTPVQQRTKENLQPGIQLTEEEEVQAKSETHSQQTAPAGIQANIDQRKGGGSPLSGPVKTFMESRIGADFSNVRIHTDDHAHKLSAKLNAQAFAVGNNVFFNEGKFNPETKPGKHLLAHELTHTVQQGSSKTLRKQDEKQPFQLTEPQLGKPTKTPGQGALNAVTLDNFVTGSHNLTAAHKARLKSQAGMLKMMLSTNPGAYAIITGHTDAVGKDENNQGLSERRAQRVVDELTSLGIPSAQLEARGKGESMLKVKSKTAQGANRRVEITFAEITASLGVKLDLEKKEPISYKELFPKMPVPEHDPTKLDIDHMNRVHDEGQPYKDDSTPNQKLDRLVEGALDKFGIKDETLRGLVKKGIMEGVNKGITTGLDSVMDSSESLKGKKAGVKKLIDTLRSHGLKKHKDYDK